MVAECQSPTLAKQDKALVGIDIGGTKIETVLLGAGGTLLDSCRVPAHRGNDAVVNDVLQSVRQVTNTLHSQDAFSVGIGIPGQVNSLTGMVRSAVNLSITELALGTELSRRLGGATVHVENDVNAAALGADALEDGTLGASKQGTTSVFINFGTGLAAGTVRAGKIDHGDTGICGEIGHIPVEPHQLPCACGQHGCLETVASGGAIERLWPNAEGPAMPDLIAKAEAGDAAACEVLSTVLHGQALAITIAGLAIDPAHILIGGGVARTGEPLLRHLKETLEANAQGSAFLTSARLDERIELVPANQPVGAIGAALSAQ